MSVKGYHSTLCHQCRRHLLWREDGWDYEDMSTHYALIVLFKFRYCRSPNSRMISTAILEYLTVQPVQPSAGLSRLSLDARCHRYHWLFSMFLQAIPNPRDATIPPSLWSEHRDWHNPYLTTSNRMLSDIYSYAIRNNIHFTKITTLLQLYCFTTQDLSHNAITLDHIKPQPEDS